MKTILFVFCLSVGFAFAGQAQSLNQLVQFMQGSFDSYEQAKNDSAYFDVSLEMVKIWKKDKQTRWLYVEQAITKNKEKPYRQRIYGITQIAENEFVSTVYLIPEEENYVGAYKKSKKRFKKLSPKQLTEKEGCEITLSFNGTLYTGSTDDRSCPSKLRGATYATSEVEIYKDQLLSRDRGFDENNGQVWGAEKGAYIFQKK